jgi:hypothetical protein
MAKRGKTKKATKMKFSDSATIVFADVKRVLNRIADNAIKPISSSPHGRFWNTDRNSFVNQYVNMTAPLTSTFYMYLKNDIMPPPPGPPNTVEDVDLMKMWLSTGFH